MEIPKKELRDLVINIRLDYNLYNTIKNKCIELNITMSEYIYYVCIDSFKNEDKNKFPNLYNFVDYRLNKIKLQTKDLERKQNNPLKQYKEFNEYFKILHQLTINQMSSEDLINYIIVTLKFMNKENITYKYFDYMLKLGDTKIKKWLNTRLKNLKFMDISRLTADFIKGIDEENRTVDVYKEIDNLNENIENTLKGYKYVKL
jgi:hypothetical protein